MNPKKLLSLLTTLAAMSLAFVQTTVAAADAVPADSKPVAAAGKEVAVISTTYGDMTIAFWPEVAPNTVENFKKLARDGFYDHTAFHRIIKGFMIQGGCPNTKPGATGTPGTGDAGYKIKAEFNSRSHVRGVISMARSSDPDSAGSQFFICHGDAKFLDRQYTAFGQLIAGDDVLDKIATAPTRPDGRENSTPRDRIEVKSIRIVEQTGTSKN
ncbi:peptidyl-prolyl cis-trans isomerase [Opitutaceae bacterium TAV5]|nr:peptidyl-prolyl cis-trans isomerase [Opitutaceae bacterium TAV5]